jgi:hypothetical protein
MDRPVKRIVLGDPALPVRPSSTAPPPKVARALGWIVPPLMLLAVAAAVWLIVRGPDLLFGLVLSAIFGVGFLWVLVSSLLPGKADRGCPSCGADALVRLSEETTTGVRCTACGHRDETASAWLLAEDEGPLERIVLRERAERRRARRAGPPPPEEVSR